MVLSMGEYEEMKGVWWEQETAFQKHPAQEISPCNNILNSAVKIEDNIQTTTEGNPADACRINRVYINWRKHKEWIRKVGSGVERFYKIMQMAECL